MQRLTNLRAAANSQRARPGPEGSTAKLAYAELNQRIYELCVDLLGAEGMLYDSYEMRRPDGGDGSAADRSRGCSSGPGPTRSRGAPPRSCATSSGERVLGLPGDVRADKGVPWSQVPRN